MYFCVFRLCLEFEFRVISLHFFFSSRRTEFAIPNWGRLHSSIVFCMNRTSHKMPKWNTNWFFRLSRKHLWAQLNRGILTTRREDKLNAIHSYFVALCFGMNWKQFRIQFHCLLFRDAHTERLNGISFRSVGVEQSKYLSKSIIQNC